jgi:hypothetical protein
MVERLLCRVIKKQTCAGGDCSVEGIENQSGTGILKATLVRLMELHQHVKRRTLCQEALGPGAVHSLQAQEIAAHWVPIGVSHAGATEVM